MKFQDWRQIEMGERRMGSFTERGKQIRSFIKPRQLQELKLEGSFGNARLTEKLEWSDAGIFVAASSSLHSQYSYLNATAAYSLGVSRNPLLLPPPCFFLQLYTCARF